MSELSDIIKVDINRYGSLRIDEFMTLALAHADHGYYMKQDPFGRGGDFITAPEISQMFGEMIGAWAADAWLKLGAPNAFALVECGPGRGTLMADMLRATRGVAGFHDAAQVCLVEISPALREKQKEALQGYDIQWFSGFSDVPDYVPLIVIGNEFFDALPFRQAVYQGGEWLERVVVLDKNDNLTFSSSRDLIAGSMDSAVKPRNDDVSEGDIFEFAPEREAFMAALCTRLKAQNGAGLFIDYGHAQSATGDTFQAVYRHDYCDVFDHIGDADLTSHVDFGALSQVAGDAGGNVEAIATQGDFLRRLGIDLRARALAAHAPDKAPDIEKDLQRLIHPDQMGTLFKVMGVSYGIKQQLGGF
ncbi:MAG: class I SAM-dependent methyltransferase [Bdellovibrionales bacterium]